MKIRLIAVGALSALALTGCAGGPARGGAAALVGDERITTSRLGDLVQAVADDPAAAAPAADLPSFQLGLLGELVSNEVVEQAAARAGVSVSQAEIDERFATVVEQQGGEEAFLQAAAAQGISRDVLLSLLRRDSLEVALGDRLTESVTVPRADLAAAYEQSADQFDQVRLRQVLLPDLAAAQALLPRARALDDAGFAALATAESSETETGPVGGEVGPLPRSAFESGGEQAYGAAAFAAAPGDTFAVQAQQGAYLVRLVARETTTLAQAQPELRRALLQQQIGEAVAQARREITVRVNPRFGSWDAAQGVVLSRDEAPGRKLSLPGPPAAPAGPAPEGP